ncbi:hypothetical protein Tco_0769245 [Tanacetum coccineum]|uniref:Uncharacterized protein n=1 Tax=Tanacetum coccineum TaxID=301880 RepID=A0ABQ4Z8V5_9ASTR
MLESTRFTFVQTDLFVLGWSSTFLLFTLLAGRILLCFVLLLGFDPLARVELLTPVEGITLDIRLEVFCATSLHVLCVVSRSTAVPVKVTLLFPSKGIEGAYYLLSGEFFGQVPNNIILSNSEITWCIEQAYLSAI